MAMVAIPMVIPTAATTPTSAPPVPDAEVVALTRRLAASDDQAWSEAHARYAPRLFRYLTEKAIESRLTRARARLRDFLLHSLRP